jgi:folylpolyglutamate synthase/dihydropteroate synthase
MIFNQQGRTEALSFLPSIRDATRRTRSPGLPSFDHAMFCTNVTRTTTGYAPDFVNNQYDPREIESMATQHRFAERWSELDPGSKVLVLPTIEEAVSFARQLGSGHDETVQVLITGSLHLVGGALSVIEGTDAL